MLIMNSVHGPWCTQYNLNELLSLTQSYGLPSFTQNIIKIGWILRSHSWNYVGFIAFWRMSSLLTQYHCKAVEMHHACHRSLKVLGQGWSHSFLKCYQARIRKWNLIFRDEFVKFKYSIHDHSRLVFGRSFWRYDDQ